MNQERNKDQGAYLYAKSIGFRFSQFSSILVLLWLGIFKFTAVEAQSIYPLLKSHPFTSCVYDNFSVTTISIMVGIAEIVIALLLLFSFWKPFLGRYAGYGMIVTFLMTLSFLFTTPNTWRMIEGIPITDFFIIKDLMFLGFGIMLIEFTSITHKRMTS